MKEEQDFLKGFMFAEQVLFGLSKNFDFGRVLDRLEAIARGDVVTGPTAAEAVRTMERQTGKALPRAFRTTVYGDLSAAGVGDTDAHKARYILKSMGYLDSDWTAPTQVQISNQSPGRGDDAVIGEHFIRGPAQDCPLIGMDDHPSSVAPRQTTGEPDPRLSPTAVSAVAGPAKCEGRSPPPSKSDGSAGKMTKAFATG